MIKTYVIFLIKNFINALLYVSAIIFSLIFILNILSEIEFFKNYNVDNYLPIYLSILNSPSLIFEMFPFIFLISTQLFFLNLFKNNEINIFKYSGLKNLKIFLIISICAFLIGISIITIFYSFSSNLKKFYIGIKSNYSLDEQHLAVITKNGLWIKDLVDEKIKIINAEKIDNNFLLNVFITEFDKNYNVIRNIKSNKINIEKFNWYVFEPIIYENNNKIKNDSFIEIKSNFNYKRIQNLFSNLSSLSILKLLELRKNYKNLSYSVTEVDIQLHKLFSYPIYLVMMTIFSGIIMFSTKNFKGTILKIVFGLFFSVIIYYIFNFFYVLGTINKFSIFVSIWVPILVLSLINLVMINKINAK